MRNALVRIVALAAIVFYTTSLNAQTPSFFKDGAVWRYYGIYYDYDPPSNPDHYYTFQYSIHGDTVINDTPYVNLYETVKDYVEVTIPGPTYTYYSSNGPSFIRHDTVAQQVYYRATITSKEKLLYDFSLQVGDTVPQGNWGWLTFVVDSITTINFAGEELKMFWVSDDDNQTSGGNILEGIGSDAGLIFYNPSYTSLSCCDTFTTLQCFRVHSDTLNMASSDCDTLTIPNSIKPIHESKIELYPNPALDKVFIKLALNSKSALRIIDALGRVVKTEMLESQSHQAVLDISELQNGFYTIEIIDETLVTTRSKVVVLH